MGERPAIARRNGHLAKDPRSVVRRGGWDAVVAAQATAAAITRHLPATPTQTSCYQQRKKQTPYTHWTAESPKGSTSLAPLIAASVSDGGVAWHEQVCGTTDA